MARNLIGTGADQVSVNGMLGELAFQSKDNVNFTGGTGKLSKLDVEAISTQLGVTAVDVFVYDTRKDSDGGAWRKRCQNTSWYNETLGTDIRGTRKEFPAVAVLVTTSSALLIYDGDDSALPLWMSFSQGGSWPNNNIVGQSSSGSLTCVSAINGRIVVGFSGDGTKIINFINEKCEFYWSSYYRLYKGNIAQRNQYIGWSDSVSPYGAFASTAVNDVAMTVLPNAPIDAATGLPIPTIAVATNGGVSVIRDDGTIRNITASNSSYTYSRSVQFVDGTSLLFSLTDSSASARSVRVHKNFSLSVVLDHLTISGSDEFYATTSYSTRHLTLPKVADADASVSIAQRNIGYDTDLVRIDAATPSTSAMSCYTSSKYNTGWMPGDIKGAWLSDTTQETVVGTNLVANGDFSNGTTGWVADGNTGFTVSAGQATITQTSTNGLIYYNLPDFPAGTYTFSIKYVGGTHTNLYAGIQTSGAVTQYSLIATTGLSANTTLSATFTTTGPATGYRIALYGYFWGGTASGSTLILDDVVIRRGDADRSVNNKGLQAYGSITKTPVATGADLVAYSGFSANNYLALPYTSSLDFGVGDFSVCAWVKTNNVANNEWFIWKGDSSNYFSLRKYDTTCYPVFDVCGTVVTGSNSIADDKWHMIYGVRRGGISYLYVDGNLLAQQNATGNVNAFTGLGVGASPTGTAPCVGSSISLVRISATTPSVDQIKKMYNDEKYLFQDNAKATLYGTSDAVTALAYDEDTQLLHVGTSSGRSVFQGLRRIDNTTTAVSASISASNGLVAEQ